MKVDGKSNETAAIPDLLEMLDLIGRTVTADAMHTWREVSALIVEKGSDNVLPVKRNQKTLHEDVQVWFSDPEVKKEMLEYRHVGGGHGRIETRIAAVSHEIGWLQDHHDWPGLKAIGRIEAGQERKGKTERAVRHHHERGDFAGAAAGARPQPLADRERLPLGSRRRHGRGPDAEPDPERAGVPRRLPAHRPGHRAPHGRRPPLKGRMEIASMNDKYLLAMLANAVGKF